MRPTPLLLLAALVFWGWQTGNVVFALLMGVALEAARYTSWRGQIEDLDFNRIADLSSLLFLVLVVYQFSTRAMHGIYAILQFMPFVLFILLLAQCYSQQERLRLSALFVSLRRKPNQPHHPDDRLFDLSYPYLLLCLVSASSGNHHSLWFFLGTCGLLGWALWSGRPRRFGPLVWVLLFALACGSGFAAQIGVRNVQSAVERTVLSMLNDFFWVGRDPNRASTAIGYIGRLKLSNAIRVRVDAPRSSPLPILLKEASYDQFTLGTWSTKRADFVAIDAVAPTTWELNPAPSSGQRTVRISTNQKQEIAVIPLPRGAYHFYDEDAFEIQRNSYGTVRLETSPGLVNYTVKTGPARALTQLVEQPTENDLAVSQNYRTVFSELAEELGLTSQAAPDIITAVRSYFLTNFEYSLIQRRQWPGKLPLTTFLRETKRGHCEYFATSTVLLLRAAGVPARYTLGYSIDEFSPIERQFVGRARDAHSWAEAFVDGRWQVVDTTPPTWSALEARQASIFQWIPDLWSWVRYQYKRLTAADSHLADYYLWLVLPLLGLLVWRLYRRNWSADPTLLSSSPTLPAGPGLDSEFLELVDELQNQGYLLRAGEPLGIWLERVTADPHMSTMSSDLGPLLAIHYQHRFDPQGLSSLERQRLSDRAAACLASLKRPPGLAA